MKNRCAELSALLLLLGAAGTANAGYDFHGVLHSISTPITIDSAYLIVPPDSLAYPTTGWIAEGGEEDTFDFPDSLGAWPQRVWLRFTEFGHTIRAKIDSPVDHRWYAIDVAMEGHVMFYGAGEPSVEEHGVAGEIPLRLNVSPSVVTEQMTVRLKPVGTGRQVVEIHDAAGNVVRSLDCIAGADGIAGATWNREDEFGQLVPEGVYFCRYAAADVIATRKLLVAR